MNSQTNLVTAISHTPTTHLLSWEALISPKYNVMEKKKTKTLLFRHHSKNPHKRHSRLKSLFIGLNLLGCWESLRAAKAKKVFPAFLPRALQLLALLVSRYKCHEGAVSKVTPTKKSQAVWLAARTRNHLVICCLELDICYHCSLQLLLIDLLHINGMKVGGVVVSV